MVEDNPDDAELTLRSFKKSAFPLEIVVVRDGVEALNYLGVGKATNEMRNTPPMLILLDLNIPKIPGVEVLRRVRADTLLHAVPVVILTSSNEEKDRTETEGLGANLYLRKPIDFNDFDEVTRQVHNFLSLSV